MAIYGLPQQLNPMSALLKDLPDSIIRNMMERKKAEQAERHFQEELKLRKQAASRAGANSDLQRQLLLERVKHAKDLNDPMKAYNNFLMLQDKERERLSGQGGAQGGQQLQDYPELEKMFAGKGMFNLPNEQAVQPNISKVAGKIPVQENAQERNPNTEINAGVKNAGAIDYELLRQSPLLQGAFKTAFKYNPMGGAYTGAAREGLDLARLKKEYGANSEEYQNALAIKKEKEQQHQDLSNIRQRQMLGLKPGDVPIKDPNTGELLGFKKQLDAKERESYKNTSLMNSLYPLVINGASVLSGPGATMKLEQAAREYKSNPAARKLIDDFLIAEKALTNTTVTEANRFGSGRTNQTFNRYAESLKAEDIPKKLKKWIKEYEIPAEATKKAGERWLKILNESESKANKSIPATRSYYYDPEKQFQHEQEQMASLGGNNETDLSKMTDEELRAIAGGG